MVVTRLQEARPDTCYVAANPVDEVVDSSAAGDAFAAGYLAGRLSGSSETAAAELGHHLASVVAQYPGAIVPPEVMAELMSYRR